MHQGTEVVAVADVLAVESLLEDECFWGHRQAHIAWGHRQATTTTAISCIFVLTPWQPRLEIEIDKGRDAEGDAGVKNVWAASHDPD